MASIEMDSEEDNLIEIEISEDEIHIRADLRLVIEDTAAVEMMNYETVADLMIDLQVLTIEGVE